METQLEAAMSRAKGIAIPCAIMITIVRLRIPIVVIPNCLRNCFRQADWIHIERLNCCLAGKQIPIGKERIDEFQLVEKLEKTKSHGVRRIGARTPIGSDLKSRIGHQLPPFWG